ncbi:MAG TPA: response regulator transcription factor [Candidatus Limnocylindria bacterium]|nr:response regulator transcription factor [Candidatus Limnocylindria bacterium]
MKILVVDDEPDVASVTAMGITYHRPDFVVSECYRGVDALDRVAAETPDLVLLDLAMPDRDGFSVLSELRESGNNVPVIVVTARGLEQEKVRGLELGADDYMTKPFGHSELVARIDAVLRRYRAATGEGRSNVFSHDGLVIDFATRVVRVDGREARLTPTEYNLLYHLAINAGRVMTHETLLAKVWGREYREEVHYLKVYAGRLRTKIEPDPQNPRYVLTVRGVGYRFPGPAR